MALKASPLQKEGEEREIGELGLKKKLVKAGVGYFKPETGDEVSVHYIGTLEDGKEFDSSRDRGKPFVFKLGQDEVILGWDQGISTMRKGERAILTIPPVLAYGSAGSRPFVPPDATLVFDVELLSWASVRDVCRDGGILKRIVKEGMGWATPKDADEVIVKYEARLDDGTIVAKTSDLGTQFYVRDGHFCPAISKAIKTMKRGEVVSLSVKPQYAFGEKGSSGSYQHSKVPPYSNLTINLELLTWKSVEILVDNENVVKKILKAGEGYEKPNEGSVVSVKFVAKLVDGTIFENKGLTGEPFQFTVDADQVVLGLDVAVTKMKKGEIASITITPEYGFGAVETKRDLAVVPPNSTLVYEVELVSFAKEKDFWQMNATEKLEAAAKKKEEGNAFFKAGNYWRAAKRYERAAIYIEQDKPFSGDEKQQVQALKLSCYLNCAACKLKLNEFRVAVDLCSRVLELEPENLKALYRRLQAYIQVGELDLAESDIQKALVIDPDNREVKLELKKLRQIENQYQKKSAEMFENLFSRMKKVDIATKSRSEK
ncbi:hypothetical protein L7F22_017986 [Adiantum nelumboides]|nr:hypothetical protein [Adiantum nelumboides]